MARMEATIIFGVALIVFGLAALLLDVWTVARAASGFDSRTRFGG